MSWIFTPAIYADCSYLESFKFSSDSGMMHHHLPWLTQASWPDNHDTVWLHVYIHVPDAWVQCCWLPSREQCHWVLASLRRRSSFVHLNATEYLLTACLYMHDMPQSGWWFNYVCTCTWAHGIHAHSYPLTRFLSFPSLEWTRPLSAILPSGQREGIMSLSSPIVLNSHPTSLHTLVCVLCTYITMSKARQYRHPGIVEGGNLLHSLS